MSEKAAAAADGTEPREGGGGQRLRQPGVIQIPSLA